MDASASRKILIEGERGQAVFNTPDTAPNKIGNGMPFGVGHNYRLRSDQFFFHLPPGVGKGVLQQLTQLTENVEASVTVTDISHGWADLLLVGPEAPTLLSRMCGLNFSDGNFADLTVQQSSVAKSRQLIIRRDFKTQDTQSVPAYSLIGDRSLAAYLWGVLFESGHDLDIIPAGQAAFNKLSLID
jgi:sarcosine oxidase gamma subunit